MNPVIDQLRSHRSIRKYTSQPIDEALFLQLIEAGQSSATSSFLQGATIIRVRNPDKRSALAELSGNKHVNMAAEFLVFCADLRRAGNCCEKYDKPFHGGYTEQFIIATIDATLMAQNVVVAAESAGLGICYIGGVRNNPQEISDLLGLPDHVYPVFGMCLGYPAHQPDVKPRLPVEAVLKEDTYTDDRELVAAFDDTMHAYYRSRKGGPKDSTWSQNLTPLFDSKLRPHMRDFLVRRGFEMK